MYCQIDWSRFEAIATYTVPDEDKNKPAEPISFGKLLPAGRYYSLTTGARVAVHRVDEIEIKWIKTNEKERMKVVFASDEVAAEFIPV